MPFQIVLCLLEGLVKVGTQFPAALESTLVPDNAYIEVMLHLCILCSPCMSKWGEILKCALST